MSDPLAAADTDEQRLAREEEQRAERLVAANAAAARIDAAFAALEAVAKLAAEASTALATLRTPENGVPLSDDVEEKGFFAAYAEFAKTLRTWFVAYGIGAPVLMLSQERVSSPLLASGEARSIAVAFLAGVGLQIMQAFIYKVTMWNLYMVELSPARKTWWRTKVFNWISHSLALELLFDVITLALCGYATFKLFMVVTNTPQGPPGTSS